MISIVKIHHISNGEIDWLQDGSARANKGFQLRTKTAIFQKRLF